MTHLGLGHQQHGRVAAHELPVSGGASVVATVQPLRHRQLQESVVRRVVADLVDPLAETIMGHELRLVAVGLVAPVGHLGGSHASSEGGQLIQPLRASLALDR